MNKNDSFSKSTFSRFVTKAKVKLPTLSWFPFKSKKFEVTSALFYNRRAFANQISAE